MHPSPEIRHGLIDVNLHCFHFGRAGRLLQVLVRHFRQILAHVCLQLFDEDALRGYLGLHLSVRAAGDAQPHRATAIMRVSGDSGTWMGVVVVVDV